MIKKKEKATTEKTQQKSSKLPKPLKFSGGRSGAEVIVHTILLEAGLFAVLILIEPTKHFLWLLPILLALINEGWYLVWKVGKIKPPYYFFISLLFLILTHSSPTLDVGKIILLALVVIVLTFIIMTIVCKVSKIDLDWQHLTAHKIFGKYKALFKKEPIIKKRLVLHSLILIIAGIIAVAFYDIRGYWAAISAAAVLAGEDLDTIKGKGVMRIAGALIGFIAGTIVIMLVPGTTGAVILLLLGTVATMTCLPADKYAIGSAGIGLSAVAIASLVAGETNQSVLDERLLWTVVGAIVVVVVIGIGSHIGKTKVEQ